MKLGKNGQILIPTDVSQRLGWTPETELDVVQRDNGLLLRPVETAPDPTEPKSDVDIRPDDELTFREFLERYAGSADAGFTTDEIMEMTRGED